MKEEVGNLWDYHAAGEWVAITTNPIVNYQGKLVMGRGVALQAAQRFPGIRERLAELVLEQGNHVLRLNDLRIFTYPVKHHWKERADKDLIMRSAIEIATAAVSVAERVYIPRPGCGNGGLDWAMVRKWIAPLLDDRFILVSRQEEIP